MRCALRAGRIRPPRYACTMGWRGHGESFMARSNAHQPGGVHRTTAAEPEKEEMTRRITALATVLVLAGAAAFADAPRVGMVTGVVEGPDGSPMPGATVQLVSDRGTVSSRYRLLASMRRSCSVWDWLSVVTMAPFPNRRSLPATAFRSQESRRRV